MAHQDLVEKAQEAITAVFSDTSESRTITKESLEELSGFIDDFLITLVALDEDEKAGQ